MRSPRHLLAGAACLAVAAASLAGCGSSESSSSSEGSSTTRAAATSTTAATSTSAAGTDAFCTEAVADYNAALETITSTSEPPTPAAFKVMVEAAQRSNQQLADEAPEEITADVDLVVRTTAAFYQALADAGYDVTQMSSDAVTKAQDAMAAPDVADATARIKTYVKDTCGVDLTVPGSGTS